MASTNPSQDPKFVEFMNKLGFKQVDAEFLNNLDIVLPPKAQPAPVKQPTPHSVIQSVLADLVMNLPKRDGHNERSFNQSKFLEIPLEAPGGDCASDCSSCHSYGDNNSGMTIADSGDFEDVMTLTLSASGTSAFEFINEVADVIYDIVELYKNQSRAFEANMTTSSGEVLTSKRTIQ